MNLKVRDIENSLSNTAGNYSKDYCINSMATCSAGNEKSSTDVIPALTPNISKKGRLKTGLFCTEITTFAILSQILFLKSLEPLLRSTSIKSLGLSNYKTELKELSKYPISDVLTKIKPEINITKTISKRFPGKNRGEILNINKNLEVLINKIKKSNGLKEISTAEIYTKASEMLEKVKDSTKYLKFIFGGCFLGLEIGLAANNFSPILKKNMKQFLGKYENSEFNNFFKKVKTSSILDNFSVSSYKAFEDFISSPYRRKDKFN